MRRKRKRGLAAVGLLTSLLGAVAAPPAAAQAPPAAFTFKKVAAVGGAAPGGGELREFPRAPSLDLGRLAFQAVAVDGGSGRLGVFLSDDAGDNLATALDSQTAVPDGTGTFAGFGALSLDSGAIAVIGFDETGASGIYLAGAGPPSMVAHVGTPLAPGSDTTFTGFFDLSLSLGRVAFLAETLRVIADSSFPEGLLSAGAFRSAAGAFQTVADEGAAAPPGPGSFAFGAPPACCVSLDGDRVAFSPAGPAGIYGQTEGLPVDAVADSSTVIDGTSFTVLDRPAIHRGAIVFTATGAVRQGVFLAAGGAFSMVADTATTVPGRAGDPTFGFFGQPSIHQGQVAFKGCTADVKCGVYTTLGGGLNKVVALGDVLDGQTVDDVEVSREAISCSSVAFLARFSGGGQAVYRADLAGGAPCPGGLDSLGALTVWGGLKSSDDQGTAFDVRAEVRVDGVLVAEGEARCVTGLTRNPSRARPVEVPFPALSPGGTAGDGELSLTVLARVGTDGAGGRCSGPGATHASAAGLRVYFDSLSRPSRFGVGVNGGSAQTLYLHGSGPACSSRPGPPGTALSLDGVAPTALVAQCADSRAVDFKGGNPWREVGTWTASLAGAAGATAAPTAPSGWRERLRAWRAR